jgi:hypothetical protein
MIERGEIMDDDIVNLFASDLPLEQYAQAHA